MGVTTSLKHLTEQQQDGQGAKGSRGGDTFLMSPSSQQAGLAWKHSPGMNDSRTP